MRRVHPWLQPVTKLAVVLTAVVVVGLVGTSLGLRPAGYVALIASIVLLGIVAPLLLLLVVTRHPDELSRRQRARRSRLGGPSRPCNEVVARPPARWQKVAAVVAAVVVPWA